VAVAKKRNDVSSSDEGDKPLLRAVMTCSLSPAPSDVAAVAFDGDWRDIEK
jgi:hypothetical protein